MEQEMHEHLSNLVIGAGSVFIIAGVIQVSCQAFEVRRQSEDDLPKSASKGGHSSRRLRASS
jgi:hypothetical protein